jgi:hypothetical protein
VQVLMDFARLSGRREVIKAKPGGSLLPGLKKSPP